MNGLVLVMTVAGRAAALPASEIQSVVELETVVPVPRAPAHVLGLSALRSSTLTVVDTAAAIGLAPRGLPDAGDRVAIVDHGGHRYALAVDAVDDIAEVFGEPRAVPGDVGAGWQAASSGLVETARGPALLLTLAAILGEKSAVAA
jgi:purine-binding chemotaxis protein CheW